MTAQEWQAETIEGTGKVLAHWIRTTEADKATWCPSASVESKARSVLAMAAECAGANRFIAGAIAGQPVPHPGPSEGVPFNGDREEAARQVTESASALAAEVRNLSDADLDREVETRRGTMKVGFMIRLAANHMMYHGGQINYIQCLYGDTEFRFPQD